MGILGGTDSDFTYGKLIFAMAILFLLPTALSLYVAVESDGDQDITDLLEGYQEFTGTSPTKEAVWALTGVYTPYTGGDMFGHTADGWLYQERIGGGSAGGYSPSQFTDSMAYSVRSDDRGLYRYVNDTNNGSHKAGDLYTSISMDVHKKSDIFFNQSNKVTDGDLFYYEYTGYRYAFQPLADYKAVGIDNKSVDVVATTTSLSLVWYEYYGNSGISGQLVLTGSDTGIAYLTANEIIRAFDSITSTAKFNMSFNGVDMNIYIRMNPYYMSQGIDVKDCFDLGYWELMVTSTSTETDAYTGTDYNFNVADIFNTMVKLFTFNAADLGLEGWTGTIASLVFSLPLYAALLTIGMNFYPVLIFAGLLAAIQGLGHIL